MDSLRISNIRSEKTNAIKKRHHRQKIANLFRIVEMCLVLILISRFTVQLPITFKNSGEYFKDLLMALVSPRSVFVIGNVIVVILYAKSGQFSAKNSSKTDIYEEFLEKSEKSQGMYGYQNRGKQSTIEEQRIVTGDTHNNNVLQTKKYRRSQSEKSKSVDCDNALETKKYRRSQSEKSISLACDKSRKELRRKLTEKGDSLEKKLEDKMSNEEFRQTIEAFIARQQRLIREEEEEESSVI